MHGQCQRQPNSQLIEISLLCTNSQVNGARKVCIHPWTDMYLLHADVYFVDELRGTEDRCSGETEDHSKREAEQRRGGIFTRRFPSAPPGIVALARIEIPHRPALWGGFSAPCQLAHKSRLVLRPDLLLRLEPWRVKRRGDRRVHGGTDDPVSHVLGGEEDDILAWDRQHPMHGVGWYIDQRAW